MDAWIRHLQSGREMQTLGEPGGVASLPPEIDAVLAANLVALPESARALLQRASVQGEYSGGVGR